MEQMHTLWIIQLNTCRHVPHEQLGQKQEIEAEFPQWKAREGGNL